MHLVFETMTSQESQDVIDAHDELLENSAPEAEQEVNYDELGLVAPEWMLDMIADLIMNPPIQVTRQLNCPGQALPLFDMPSQEKGPAPVSAADVISNLRWNMGLAIFHGWATPNLTEMCQFLLNFDLALEKKLVPIEDQQAKLSKIIGEAKKFKLIASWGRRLLSRSSFSRDPHLQKLKTAMIASIQDHKAKQQGVVGGQGYPTAESQSESGPLDFVGDIVAADNAKARDHQSAHLGEPSGDVVVDAGDDSQALGGAGPDPDATMVPVADPFDPFADAGAASATKSYDPLCDSTVVPEDVDDPFADGPVASQKTMFGQLPQSPQTPDDSQASTMQLGGQGVSVTTTIKPVDPSAHGAPLPGQNDERPVFSVNLPDGDDPTSFTTVELGHGQEMRVEVKRGEDGKFRLSGFATADQLHRLENLIIPLPTSSLGYPSELRSAGPSANRQRLEETLAQFEPASKSEMPDPKRAKRPPAKPMKEPEFLSKCAMNISEHPPKVVSPAMQTAATGIADSDWLLSSEAIPDPERKIPENFCSSVHEAYMRVPTEALPRIVGTGKKNYTLTDAHGAKIEVQLSNCAFYIKTFADKGLKVTNPSNTWSMGIEKAWEQVKERINWRPA